MRLLRHRSPPPPPARRPRAEPRPAPPTPADEPPDPEPAAADPPLDAERRLRASGGPDDRATYACRCGAVFPASPTTSVSCPLCGVHQAW